MGSDGAQPDWERIEQDYRAGLLSVREIAAQQHVSHTAIQKRAKRDRWARDLTVKIKARAESLVAKREVATEVATETAATDRAIIEANAEVIAQIRLTHRKDIARARKLAMKLLEELEHTGDHIDLIEKLSNMVDADRAGETADAAEKRWKALSKVLELPTRTGTMKMLAETMTKLIALEREAYSLETAGARDPGEPASVKDFVQGILREIDGAGTGLPRHAVPTSI